MLLQTTILTLVALAGFVTSRPQPRVPSPNAPLTPGTTNPGSLNPQLNDSFFPPAAYIGKGVDMTSLFPSDIQSVRAFATVWMSLRHSW